jgi:hypothetical protein
VLDFKGSSIDIWTLFENEHDMPTTPEDDVSEEGKQEAKSDDTDNDDDDYVVFFGGVVRKRCPEVVEEADFDMWGDVVQRKVPWLAAEDAAGDSDGNGDDNSHMRVHSVRIYDLYNSFDFAAPSPVPYSVEVAQVDSKTQTLRNHQYVFCSCYSSLPFFSFVCDGIFDSLSIYCCLPAFSDTTTWHESNHHLIPPLHQSIDTILTLLITTFQVQTRDTRLRGCHRVQCRCWQQQQQQQQQYAEALPVCAERRPCQPRQHNLLLVLRPCSWWQWWVWGGGVRGWGTPGAGARATPSWG